MALSYQRRTTISTNSVRDVNRENNTKLGAAAKENVKSFGTRHALGNVSNKQTVNNKLLGAQPRKAAQKGEVVGTFRPRPRGLSKSTATSALLPAVEKKQPPEKKRAPAPADVSASKSSFTLEEVVIPHHVANIDKEDEDNPQLVSEYVNEIYSYMRYMEVTRVS